MTSSALPNGYINVWSINRDGRVSETTSFFREIDDAIEEVDDGGPINGWIEYRHTVEILGGALAEIDLREQLDAWREDAELQRRHERGLRAPR